MKVSREKVDTADTGRGYFQECARGLCPAVDVVRLVIIMAKTVVRQCQTWHRAGRRSRFCILKISYQSSFDTFVEGTNFTL